MSDLKIVFMGSPDIAVPTLRALAAEYNVVGVVTQPDREAGRGKKIVMPAVKTAALELGIPVIQPEKMKQPGVVEQLEAWNADMIVVMAFGKILRSWLLDMPKYGCLNVHASLLPRWRGASPIQAAILNGDAQSGVTIMQMDPGMDTGPMLSVRALDIAPDDTTGTLSDKLAELGAELLMETIPGYLDGSIRPQAQPEEGMTYTGLISKSDGLMDFTQSVCSLECKVRAFDPWPSAFFMLGENSIKVLKAHIEENPDGLPAGTHLVFRKFPAIAAADGILVLDEVQAPGKKPMPGSAFLSGCRSWME